MKGYTLMELLAVLAIIATIFLIAVPTILNTIENSKQNAYKSSLKLIAGNAKVYITQQELRGCITFGFGNDPGDFSADDVLEISGDLPTEGTMEICDNVVTYTEVSNDNYMANTSETDPNEIVVVKLENVPVEPTYLINGSDLNVPVTGGWYPYYTTGDSGFALNGNSKYELWSSWGGGISTILTVNKLDLNNYETITFDVNLRTNSEARTNTTYVGVYSLNESSATINFTDSQSFSTNSTSDVNHIFVLDLADLQDEYYIKIAVQHTTSWAYTSVTTINSILME